MEQSGPNGQNMTEQEQGGPNKIKVDRIRTNGHIRIKVDIMDRTGPNWTVQEKLE